MRARRNRSLSARYGSVENPWLAKHVVRFKLDCQGTGFNSPRLHQPSPEAPRRAKAADSPRLRRSEPELVDGVRDESWKNGAGKPSTIPQNLAISVRMLLLEVCGHALRSGTFGFRYVYLLESEVGRGWILHGMTEISGPGWWRTMPGGCRLRGRDGLGRSGWRWHFGIPRGRRRWALPEVRIRTRLRDPALVTSLPAYSFRDRFGTTRVPGRTRSSGSPDAHWNRTSFSEPRPFRGIYAFVR